MKGKLIALGLAGTTAAIPFFADAKSPAGEKPNIVIIYTDDMGVGDLSRLNDGWVRTPNLDRMASEGLVVKNYYTAAPVSSASRTGLTTGMFPLEWGINTYLSDRKHNENTEQFDYLDPASPSMARVLKEAGYATGHFGKWHMGGGRDVDDAPQITAYGFDEYVSTWESPDPDPAITGDPTWIWSDRDDIKRWNRTAYFVDRTLDFMSRHRDTPCFVNLWPDDVHTPWVPDEKAAKARTGWESQVNFEEVLHEYDIQIGRFMDELKSRGLDKNTIVIFTSDNGPAPSFNRKRTNGLRGTKNSLYEGGILMPFIVWWPGVITPGTVDATSVVCAVDILPTLCAITGAPLPEGFHMSGEDMSCALTGSPQTRTKDITWDFGRNSFYADPGAENKSPHLALRRGDWKVLTNGDGTRTELYNIASDAFETDNVAKQHPELVADMKKVLLEWWAARKTPPKAASPLN